jgi:hypothetical protein
MRFQIQIRNESALEDLHIFLPLEKCLIKTNEYVLPNAGAMLSIFVLHNWELGPLNLPNPVGAPLIRSRFSSAAPHPRHSRAHFISHAQTNETKP